MENSEDEWHSEELKSEGDSSEFQELPTDQGDLGCKHYRRGCLKQCPNPICEGKYYPCRLCHDEAQESITDPKRHHLFDRHKVTQVKCLRCQEEQPKAKTCVKCHKDFAKYYCPTCAFYDDQAEAKKVYHCDKCGICRVGGRDSQFHCDKCGCCYAMHMLNNHECKEARFKQDCPICLSDMHNSIRSASILRCGHSIHSKCLKEYSKNNIACPICKKSLFDITQHEEFYDVQIQAVTMPSEYANTWMKMLCNDCLHVSEIKFHFMGGKCDRCKSYNTTQTGGLYTKSDEWVSDQSSSEEEKKE